jgi:O-antigen ligase
MITGPDSNRNHPLQAPTPAPLSETLDHRLWRWWGGIFGILLVGYLFFDRAFAHIHISHTSAYVGELTLTFGLVCVAVGTRWLRLAVVGDALVGLLIAWMVWGLCRTIPNVPEYGVSNAIHDAALWYYGGFAVLLLAAATAVPELGPRYVRAFSKVLPWLICWLPFTLLATKLGFHSPSIRWDNVPLLSHKPGNITVTAAICLAWLLLVPEPGRSPTVRRILIGISLVTIVLGATQTRGGGLAAVTALILALTLMPKERRGSVVTGGLVALFLLVGVGTATGAALHTSHRTISISQLFENAQSVGGGSSSNQLQGSVNFRESLWSTILDQELTTQRIVTGFGFGPDLTTIGGLNPKPNQASILELRSAHNSLLDILARMGLIGAVLWILLWVAWYRKMMRAHGRYRAVGDEANRGVIDACMVAPVAIMLNSFFDPTLEGAQVAAILFAAFALGILADRARLVPAPES